MKNKLLLRSLQLGFVIILVHLVNYSSTQFTSRVNCPPVPDRSLQNVEVKCMNSYGSDLNCSYPLTPGSIVRFKCPEYFEVKNGTQFSRENKEIYCSSSGKWSDFQNFMRFACVPECGYMEVKSTTTSENNGPPWQATILKNRRTEYCEGFFIPSLIGNTSVILTSRDCISSSNGTQLLSKDLRVAVNRKDFSREFSVKSIFVPLDQKSNIAILNLSAPLSLSENLLPVCLPWGHSNVQDQRLMPGTIGNILGTETLKTDLNILSSEKCSQGFGYSPTDTEFCTIKVSEDSPVSCPIADGPFLLPVGANFSSSSKFLRFKAYGVQSGNLRVNSCQLGIIFTRITAFQSWINQVLRDISGIKEVPKPVSITCDQRSCGDHSYCKRDERQEVHCVCEDGYFRDPKNVYAECKRKEKVNQIRTTESPSSSKNRTTTKPSQQYVKPVPEVTTCPSFNKDDTDGFDIECNFNHRGVDCFRHRQPVGTTAIYTCKTFYNPPTVGSSLANRVCQSNGSWTNLRRDFTCTLTCGEDGIQGSGGGNKGSRKKWPWVAGLYYEEPLGSDRFKFICGGTLVSQNAVVTGAQCVTQRTSTRLRNATSMRIVLGKYYRDFEKRHMFAQERLVKEINIHSEFKPYSWENDIAVIFMDKPAKITEGVHPICLPTIRDDATAIGDLGILASWGRKEDGNFPSEINEIKLPIVSNGSCIYADDLLMEIVQPPKNFCAGYLNATLIDVVASACDEDEGSGLYFQTSQRPKTWRLQGITSAILKKPDGQCRRDVYSVFTNVTTFRPWLDTILDKDVSRAY